MAAITALAVIASAIWGQRAWRALRSAWGDDQANSSSAATAARVPLPTDAGASTPTASPSSSHLALEPAAQLAAAGAMPDAKTVRAAIDKVARDKVGLVGARVVDPATGTVLDDLNGTRAMLPASTNKLLTCTTVLDALGPWKRFTTTVTSPARGRLVLVGGGDPYLASKPSIDYPARPTTQALAAATAKALKAQHVTQVSLGYDDSLFTGPGWNPTWTPSYNDQVSSISALMVDEGSATRITGSAANPTAKAADTFAQQLSAAGIKVVGHPGRVRNASGAAEVAHVDSLPVATLVQQTLLHSDNTAAEVLLRQAAVASHRPGSFAGGVASVQDHLTRLGIWKPQAHLVDGSGLSRADRVTPEMLTLTLRAATTTANLAPLLEGLPVAAMTGTMVERFAKPAGVHGRGIVHAKTGTLNHVSGFAGWTLTRSGRPLLFALLVNGPDPAAKVKPTTPGTDDFGMRDYLDAVTASLSMVP